MIYIVWLALTGVIGLAVSWLIGWLADWKAIWI